MSWVTENKFLTGFGAVMLAGLGTLGWFTWSAMGKYDDAAGAFDAASSQLKALQQAKPSLTAAHLKELLAQKQEMTEKIGAFQNVLKSRVLPIVPIEKAAFQDKLKEAVARVTAKAAEAKVERPKDFYLGFAEYQSKPPDDKAAPALARELQAIELVMDVLIQAAKSGSIELNELYREPLPEEGRTKANEGQGGTGRRKNAADRSGGGIVEKNGLRLKITSNDEALRKVLNALANHKQQLFIIRNLTVMNTKMDSPPRLAAAAPPPPAPGAEQPAAAPTTPLPAGTAPAPAGTAPAPAASPAPAAAPEPAVNEGPLAYVFGTEKIISVIEVEVLNIEEPKQKSDKPEKPEKAGKKKEK
ncbi:MAG: Amuc_1100 family pilus-like protein [Chthoniobacteraceae bacterium]